MDDLAAHQQTVAHVHLGGDGLVHAAPLVEQPLVATGDNARRAILVAKVRERKEEADLCLGPLGPELCVGRVRGQVPVQHLARLRAHGVERRGRRELVVTVVAALAEAALADGVDDVVLHDALAEGGTVVDEVPCAPGLGAMESLEILMRNEGASLNRVEDGLELLVDGVGFLLGQDVLENDGATLLPVLEDFIQWGVHCHLCELEAIGHRGLRDICWNSPHCEMRFEECLLPLVVNSKKGMTG